MKASEQVKTIDGVDYEFAVRDVTTGYFGTWFCRSCWRGGLQYDLMPSIDDAITDAERRAIEHHESEHSN